MVVWLISGGGISLCQYALHLVAKAMQAGGSPEPVFTPLMSVDLTSCLKIGAGAVGCVFIGGGLRKLGTGMASETFIKYWEGVFYRK